MKSFNSITVIFLSAAGLLVSAVLHPAYARLPDLRRETQGQAKNDMRITTDQNALSIHTGERILMSYRYNSVPFKPYVQKLFTPDGLNVLLDAPSDHKHHHALMFAVTVDGVNFWEEQKTPGRQQHRRFADMTIGQRGGSLPYAGFAEQIDWINPSSGRLLLTECRRIEVSRLAEPQVTLLTWRSEFELLPGRKIDTLTGSHYHGLGMRFVRSMDGGRFFNADGKTGVVFRGEERLVRSRWCAYTTKADGKAVTAAMFDCPANQRHPATWFTMQKPFAYLSATLNLHKEPLKITLEQPLVLRYAVALWDEEVEPERIERLYKRWVALHAPEVNVSEKIKAK